MAALGGGAESMAELLRGVDTRAAALEALETTEAPIDRTLALSASQALAELLAAKEAAVPPLQFSRIALLLTRLHAEVLGDLAALAALYGAAFGEGRLAASFCSAENSVACVLRKPANELTLADARTLACSEVPHALCLAHGYTKPWGAVGLSALEWFSLFMSTHKLLAK